MMFHLLYKTAFLDCIIRIRITYLCDLYPLTPHFYIVKVGFTGVYIFSKFCSKT